MKLFIDASVWLAAIRNPEGASGMILKLASKGKLSTVWTSFIITEIKNNLPPNSKFQTIERQIKPQLINLTSKEIFHWTNLLPDKDCHVLAGAFKAKADYLISLDKKHILKAEVQSNFPIPIRSSSEFLRYWQT